MAFGTPQYLFQGSSVSKKERKEREILGFRWLEAKIARFISKTFKNRICLVWRHLCLELDQWIIPVHESFLLKSVAKKLRTHSFSNQHYPNLLSVGWCFAQTLIQSFGRCFRSCPSRVQSGITCLSLFRMFPAKLHFTGKALKELIFFVATLRNTRLVCTLWNVGFSYPTWGAIRNCTKISNNIKK